MMFSELDQYISSFTGENFALDYWYDEGVTIAQKFINAFQDGDWLSLEQALPQRSIEWKCRLAYCLDDGNNMHQLTVLLLLSDTENSELIECVVDSLREFVHNHHCKEQLSFTVLVERIKSMLPDLNPVAKKVFIDLLDSVN